MGCIVGSKVCESYLEVGDSTRHEIVIEMVTFESTPYKVRSFLSSVSLKVTIHSHDITVLLRQYEYTGVNRHSGSYICITDFKILKFILKLTTPQLYFYVK